MNIIAACVVAGVLTANAPVCGTNEVLRVDVLDRCWCEVVSVQEDSSPRGFTPGKPPVVVDPNDPPVDPNDPPVDPNDPPGNGNGGNGNRGLGNYGESDDPSPDYESNNPSGQTEPPGQSGDSPGKSGDAPGHNK